MLQILSINIIIINFKKCKRESLYNLKYLFFLHENYKQSWILGVSKRASKSLFIYVRLRDYD